MEDFEGTGVQHAFSSVSSGGDKKSTEPLKTAIEFSLGPYRDVTQRLLVPLWRAKGKLLLVEALFLIRCRWGKLV